MNRNMLFGQLMNVICRFLTYTVLYFAIIILFYQGEEDTGKTDHYDTEA